MYLPVLRTEHMLAYYRLLNRVATKTGFTVFKTSANLNVIIDFKKACDAVWRAALSTVMRSMVLMRIQSAA